MSTPYVWDRITGRDPAIRAADADRERIAERLRTSHAEGRLDLSEFEQRLERCSQAKTVGELDEIVRDLPGDDARGVAPRSGPGRGRLVALPIILLALLVISAAVAHHGFFFLWIPVMFLIWRMSWWRHRRWTAGPRRGPGGWI
jgi:hypothetical protein